MTPLSSNRFLRHRALACMKPILESSVYLRERMEEILSSSFGPQLDCCTRLLGETRKVCAPKATVEKDDYLPYTLERYLSEQGHFIGVSSNGCEKSRIAKEWMKIARSDILLLRVSKDKPFANAGFFPLIAGYTRYGQPTYCARLVYSESRRGHFHFLACTVAEGTTPEDVLKCYHLKDIAEVTFLYVLVLRYAPEAYPRRYGPGGIISGEEIGSDATGPYSWRQSEGFAFD